MKIALIVIGKTDAGYFVEAINAVSYTHLYLRWVLDLCTVFYGFC